ncbi:hypothetical protein [Empedobacter falsenii]|uniref:hypothetical protein n=1 Tax=Empedobacter falsenii TaxID=343874 RepID=UPI00126A4CBF|nr:hypothetical protein [Empedobacter falsenii]
MKNVDLIFEDLYKKSSNIFHLNNENKVSSILLFKDYISHLKKWKELLGTDYRPFGTSLNLQENNLIKDVNEDFLKELTSFEVFFNNFKDKFKIDENLIGGRVINYWFIYLYIYWEFFKQKEKFKKIKGYSNPYNSLIKLFKNDNIYIREGINVSGVTMRNSSMSLRLPSLDDDFLGYIDSKCKLVGSDGIPNQERVNELWEEFQQIK